MGCKAFEKLTLTNLRSRGQYTCEWRPCQQALPYLLPLLKKRVLTTRDEKFFAATLEARGARLDDLTAASVLCGQGLGPCCDAEGGGVAGGAVLSLLGSEEEVPLASVAAVLSPGGLQVWAPKEEVNGLLELLER